MPSVGGETSDDFTHPRHRGPAGHRPARGALPDPGRRERPDRVRRPGRRHHRPERPCGDRRHARRVRHRAQRARRDRPVRPGQRVRQRRRADRLRDGPLQRRPAGPRGGRGAPRLPSRSRATPASRPSCRARSCSGSEEVEGGEMVGLAVAIIVLLVAFGSVIAAGIPIGSALFGIFIGLGLIGVMSGLTDVPSISPMLATMIGLGVGIDYALFVVTRHRGFMHEGRSPVESAALANATSGTAVLFAGTTVVVALAGLSLAGIPSIAMMGYASAVTVARRDGSAPSRCCPRSSGSPGIEHRPAPHRAPALTEAEVSRAHHDAVRALGRPRRSPPVALRDRQLRRAGWRSPPRCWRCAPASPTTASAAPTRPTARPTTCSPTASARASTARSRSPSRASTVPPSTRPSPTSVHAVAGRDRRDRVRHASRSSTRPATRPWSPPSRRPSPQDQRPRRWSTRCATT